MRHLGGLLFVLLAGLPALSLASPLKCGVYTTADGASILTVTRPDAALLRQGEAALNALALRQQTAGLQVYNLEHGVAETWSLGSDGQALRSESGDVYTLQQSAECGEPPVRTGQCAADLPACLEARTDADTETLTRWCTEERLPFACSDAIRRFQDQASAPADAADPPAECVEGTPRYSEAACKEQVSQALAQAFASAVGGLYDDEVALPAPQLDQAMEFCRLTGAETVCTLAAEKLWTGGRLVDARAALKFACEQAGDAAACTRWAALDDIAPADLRTLRAETLPCGTYVAEGGLMSELAFQDRGRVEGGFGSVLRARLQDGRIRIRHDKGGDFVFGVIAGDRLLGLDSWNRFAVYQRRPGGASRCEPPVQYTERPLVQDCPGIGREGGAAACCEAGKLQGCNALGHARALAGDWKGAFPYYQRVCAAGVRSGCENLVQAYAQSGDETTIEALRQSCATDPRHVACDVLETSNPEQLDAARGLQQMLEQWQDDGEEEAPGAPQG